MKHEAMLSRCMRNNCVKCPNLVKTRSRIVSGYGDPTAGILIVGLAPGRNGADKTGVPFTGDPSGMLLQEALISSGISKEAKPNVVKPRLSAYITNIVKCNPQDSMGRNRPPTEKELINCTEYLVEEMNLIRPKIIVALGTIVWKHLQGREMERTMDNLIRKNGTHIVKAYHPGYAIRGGNGALSRSMYPSYFSRIIHTQEMSLVLGED
ncbi:MAG: uracil-DNA glycosylase [Candidatus Thorarchaeota archaeon]|nr:uracil-DNA glycosylase [Candidatus Thorarchaeota archaeon]